MSIALSVVCPFFNEEPTVPHFFAHIVPVLEALDLPFEIVCVNDGSRDGTLAALLAVQAADPRVRVVDLSRNFGKEAALTAGLDVARGDAVIPIDSDLQDPPELIPAMVAKWREGFEVVLARRADRTSDHPMKRTTAQWFYRVHNLVSDTAIPENVGDFRLMDRRVVEAVRLLPERRRFMKGLFAWVGFRTVEIAYRRPERVAGEGKFSGWRLWNFALEGITSFSTAPLRIWSYLGLGFATLSFAYATFIVLRTLIYGVDMPGYASVFTAVLFMGGVQLVGIGILGEYVGRAYIEAKQRPLYIIRELHEGGGGAPGPRREP